jgi:hypothetical protein
MGVTLERGVALGPGGVGNQRRYFANRRFFAETGCTWIRLWADWPTMQPAPGAAPDFKALDADIAAARADGCKVMLTAYRFARWANGTAQITAAQDPGFQLQDRLVEGADPAKRKELTFRIPDDVSEQSAWGKWIGMLADRYGKSVDALEIFNEPNLQFWPQQDASGKLTVQRPVARMIATARAALGKIGGAPLLVVPATSDRNDHSRLNTGYGDFADALLDELDAIGFKADKSVAWSHHNYGDVEGDSADRVADARRRLVGRWPGWPNGDARTPGVMITETGARLTRIATQEKLVDDVLVRRRQAELVLRNAERMRLGPEGDGVGLLLYYLFVTHVVYDSGLCELDGTPRPAYFAWAEASAAR